MTDHCFTHAGLECKVLLTRMGHHCGYVAIGPDHPYFGRGYSDEVPVSQRILDRDISIDDVGVINLLCASKQPAVSACPMVVAIDVHGGLTFAAKDKARDLWWLGFDCGHCWDGKAEGYADWRDRDYTEAQCRRLADQLAQIAAELAETPS